VGTVEIRDANRPLRGGAEVFKSQCAACHETGVAGAPNSRMQQPGARASSRAWKRWCTLPWPARVRWRPRVAASSMTRKLPVAWSIWQCCRRQLPRAPACSR
jgi:hypothetical protein